MTSPDGTDPISGHFHAIDADPGGEDSVRLVRPTGCEEEVDLLTVMQNPELATLVNHDGVLKYRRIATVLELIPDAPLILLPYDAA